MATWRTSPGVGFEKAWVDCILVEDRGPDAVVIIEKLPAYNADAPFVVSSTDLRADRAAVFAHVRRRIGANCVVDMPGEPLNFGPRLQIPADRVHAFEP